MASGERNPSPVEGVVSSGLAPPDGVPTVVGNIRTLQFSSTQHIVEQVTLTPAFDIILLHTVLLNLGHFVLRF